MVTDADSRDALVLTLEETAVSAMTCDSLICSGRFTGFCLRFATDFETSLDDWKPGERRGFPHATHPGPQVWDSTGLDEAC